jgi:hypothetical protein
LLVNNGTPGNQYASRRELLIVAAISVLATAVMFYLKHPPRFPYADEYEYLGYAFGLHHFDVFARVTNPNTMPSADMYFPPLYPYFLALLMDMDDTFSAATQCFLNNLFVVGGVVTESGCAPRYGIIIPAQILIGGLVPLFVWGTAWRLSGSTKIAVMAAILAFTSRSHPYYANHFLTEALTLPLAAALGWAMVAAWQDRTAKTAAMSAALFGMLVLTRAGWSYALLVIVPIFVCMGMVSWRARGMRAFMPLVVFGVVYGAVLSPWIIRNTAMFDTPALTGGYGATALMHRLPYNRMTDDEFVVAFIYWLPDFGDTLAAKLFPPEHYQRLNFGYAEGFYTSEQRAFAVEANAKRGDQDMFDYLIEHEILGNLTQHVTVTLAMVWRGMFVAKYWGLVTWLFFLPLLIYGLYRRWGGLIVLALPPLFMLGLNAFVSVSIPRYNLPLIPVMAFSMAYVLAHCFARLRRARHDVS